MRDLLMMANASPVKEVVILLDCCHSGALGQSDATPAEHAVLREGVSLLTASGSRQESVEVDGGGLFTKLVCGALGGEAADLFGQVTLGNIYAHVHPYLGAWSQRPRLRANISRLTPLRYCEPRVERSILRMLPEYFLQADTEYRLAPSYEPSSPSPVAEHVERFEQLQRLARNSIVEPVEHEHMYDAAMASGTCRLTPIGRHCWLLAKNGRL
jgi:hypothetical protein